MDKNSAVGLIRDVFQNPFDRNHFITFIKNLFNFFDTEKNFVYRGNFIPDSYKPYIHTLERIGKYEDAENWVGVSWGKRFTVFSQLCDNHLKYSGQGRN